MTILLSAIAAAMPHEPGCPGEHAKCICGMTGRRNVLYVRVQEHVSRITKGRVYLNE